MSSKLPQITHISRTPCEGNLARAYGRRNARSRLSQAEKIFEPDKRRQRVRKACERCRVKKVKCDAEFPCKRCKEDDLICTTARGRGDAQLPTYPEVLENTQYVLIGTVCKLYEMLRDGEEWKLEEPELNDGGRPLIHSIVDRLGFIRRSQAPYVFLDDPERQTGLYSPNVEFDKETNEGGERHDGLSSHITPDPASCLTSDYFVRAGNYIQDNWAKNRQQHQSIPGTYQASVSWLPNTSSVYSLPTKGYWEDLTASTSSSLGSGFKKDLSSPYSDFQAQSEIVSLLNRDTTTLAEGSTGPTRLDENATLDMPQCLQSSLQSGARSISHMERSGNDTFMSGTATVRQPDMEAKDLESFEASTELIPFCDITTGTTHSDLFDWIDVMR